MSRLLTVFNLLVVAGLLSGSWGGSLAIPLPSHTESKQLSDGTFLTTTAVVPRWPFSVMTAAAVIAILFMIAATRIHRSQAESERNQLRVRLNDHPRVAKAELHFRDNFCTEFGISGQPNFIWSNVTPGMSVCKLDAYVQATGPIVVESVSLTIGDHTLAPVGWNRFEIDAGLTTSIRAFFEVPKGISPGKHVANLIVYTDTGP